MCLHSSPLRNILNKILLKKFLGHSIFFFVAALLLTSWSCSSHQNKTETNDATSDGVQNSVRVALQKENFIRKDSLGKRGKVIPKISCKSNPALSFALYLPSSYDTSRKFPVIIFFDPHGSGNFVVTKYHHLAEEFGEILIGSNDSKNGLSFEQTNQIANTLVSEVISRLSVENEVTLSGFSGGARVALSSAMSNQNVSSVIYCGAAMPVQNGSRIFSALGFAGVNDMNYADVIGFDQSLRSTSYNHFLIEWNGKHEWPDSASFRDAFYWLTFNRMRAHEISFNTEMTQQFVDENNKRLKSANDLTKEATLEKVVFFLDGLYSVDKYKAQVIEIQQNPSYEKELNDKQKVLQQETAMKQQYVDDFQTKDLNWWKTEIARISAIKDPQQKPMYQRLLGFISLAGYSISNNSIQQGKFPMAEKMLAIYKLADPKNSDQPFLEACMYAKQGKSDEAIQSLQRAVDLGLNDLTKILSEPSLASLKQNEKFKLLLSKMKR